MACEPVIGNPAGQLLWNPSGLDADGNVLIDPEWWAAGILTPRMMKDVLTDWIGLLQQLMDDADEMLEAEREE